MTDRPGQGKAAGFGIQDRIVVWLLVLGILPAVGTAVLGHWVMGRAARAGAERHLREVCSRLSDEVDAELQSLVRDANRLTGVSPDVLELLRQENLGSAGRLEAIRAAWMADSDAVTQQTATSGLSARLSSFRLRDPARYRGLLLTDSVGVVVGSTRPVAPAIVSDQKWWRSSHSQGRGRVNIGQLQAMDGRYLLSLALPIVDPEQNRTLGVLSIEADLTRIAERIEEYEVGRTGFVTLSTTFGDIMVTSSPRAAAAPNTSRDRLVRLGVRRPFVYIGRGLGLGRPSVIALRPVLFTRAHGQAGAGWTVAVEQSLVEILAPTHQYGRTAVAALLLTGALVMIVGLFLSERIIRPLKRLRDGVRTVGQGRLEHRIELRTGDEIETVAGEFNAMAARLRASYAGLEEKIRQATAALSREKESLQAIVASLGEGLFVIDTENRITLWNRAAEEMTGRTIVEAIGQPCSAVLHAHSESVGSICQEACPAAEAARRSATVTRREMDTYITRRDGTRLPVNYTASPLLDEAGALQGCVVVLRDVSHEKEIGELKTRMVSTVSHELRAPLQPIIGFAELLQDNSLPVERRREYLQLIADEARRLSQLVDDFLTVSRIEEGRFDLHLADVDLRILVAEVLATEASHHPGHVLKNAIPEALVPIRADRERLRRLLYNLVSNALKYSPHGGEVRVSAAELNGRVEISVSDQGIGIRPDDVPRLFHRFQRVHRDRLPDVPGTGLGLAICRGIVEEHGGSISVISELGRGSTFTVALPVTGPQVSRRTG